MRVPIILAILISVASCEHGLHNYSSLGIAYAKSKDTATYNKYQKEIKNIIDKNETQNSKVPAGLYAEYAYMLYKQKRFDEARGVSCKCNR